MCVAEEVELDTAPKRFAAILHTHSVRFQPGFRFGPYVIVSRLGAGGMGEVFHARDTKLNRDVALKVLLQDSSASPERLNRFELEARAASQLNHPNIVTIYDIGRIDEVTFIVMELVEGRNLRDLSAERDLPLREIARLVGKLAEGLAAAHDRGIIHRDLKPENVMVTPDGFVKILDFGLAKLTHPISDAEVTLPHSTPGAVLGTINYMSPEQARAGASDFRCDQFSLGVILYELVARRRPFNEPTAAETMTAIIRDDPPPLSRTGEEVPPRLRQIVERCLSKEPRDRYASTRDLARDLRELRGELSSGRHSTPPGPRVETPRRRALIAAVAALVILAVAGTLWMQRARARPARPQRHALFFVSLQSGGGGRDGEVFSDGLTDAISARLAKSADLRVIRSQDDAAKPAGALDAARRHGADLVLQGVAQRAADRVRISYSILDAKSASQIGGDTVTGSPNEVFALQDLVADGVLRLTGGSSLAPRTEIGGLDRPADQQSYVTALGLLHRMKDRAALDEAIHLLEGLLRNARDSAAVNGALGKALLRKYNYTKESPLVEQASLYATRAAEIDSKLPDVHVTLGDLNKTRGDLAGAAAEYQKALTLHPDFPDAALGLADTFKKMGRAADAQLAYEHVIALAPDWPTAYGRYGIFWYDQGKFDEAAEAFRTQIRLMPDAARGYMNLGAALMALGQFDEALQAFQRSLTFEKTSPAYADLGSCQYNLGRFADAAISFQTATAMTANDPVLWMNLGDARRWAPGQRAAAAAAYERAVDRSRAVLKVNQKDGLAHALIASALAKLGRSAEARREMERALKLEPTNADVLYQSAVVALLRGDREGAAAWLRRALDAGYSAPQAAHDPELAELR